MIYAQTLAGAHARRRAVDKPQFRGSVTDLIGSSLERSDRLEQPSPQAFLVEQPPNWSLQTHFHLRHQFQVIVRGSGLLGRHAVGPLCVHYTSPHSGYGPLVAGDQGLAYLTLRVVSDTSAWYLPDAREHLKMRIPKQQLHAAPSQADADLASIRLTQQETLIDLDTAGLGAWLVRLPSHARFDVLGEANRGSGRFYVVTRGALVTGDDELTGLAAVFMARDDHVPMEAGAQGAEVIVLQFPDSALQALPD